jgi:RecA-family ATPase
MVFYDADDVVTEREAMAAIDRALETLKQPSARQRVMRWAAEKFHIDTASTPSHGTIGAPYVEQESDPVLNDSVDNAAAAEQVSGNEPVDELFRELAADFQRLALERRRA